MNHYERLPGAARCRARRSGQGAKHRARISASPNFRRAAARWGHDSFGLPWWHSKGRDLYDLLWYLSDPEWPAPNFAMLNNALIQTGWEGAALDERNWQDVVRRRLEAQAWERVAADVQPFLQNPREAELLTWSTFAQLLEPSPRTTS